MTIFLYYNFDIFDIFGLDYQKEPKIAKKTWIWPSLLLYHSSSYYFASSDYSIFIVEEIADMKSLKANIDEVKELL